MKKAIAILMVLGVLLSLCACGSKAPKATVVTNSGETKQMTLEEIKEIEESNEVLFEEEYVGADITVTSTVTKIGGAYLFKPWFECEAYVELEADNVGCWFHPITEEYAATLNVGDEITVSGKIGMASVSSFNIFILEDEISPY